MKRNLRIIAAALAIAALAACSHKNAHAPLSYVPADTPYLVANLKPMDADTREALFKQANAQLPLQMTQIRQAASKLEADNKPHLAALLRVYAAEFDGRTVQQAITHMGLDINGLYALYGLGMSPVVRMQLSDPKAFEAFVGRIEKALGKPLDTATLNGTSYRQIDFGKGVALRFIVAVEHKQAVMALLPADADNALMRSALGLDKPKQSVQSSGKLARLADANGYKPYSLAYVDLAQWPALIAGEKDPMIKTLLSAAPKAAEKIPASCQADFSRIAARMPMLSFGMTEISDKRLGYRGNIRFAADIAKAFSGIDVKLPGLGEHGDSPLDMALALPVKEIRTFWMAQAEAVAAKPFTCPALTALNGGFEKLRMNLIKTAMPPFNDLRGVRVALDSLELPSQDTSVSKPIFSGLALVASDNPEGLLSMAQLAAPPLRDLKVGDNGKPVALPDALTRMIGGQPAWVAMNGHLLGVAVGAGEDKHLASTMDEKGKARGMITRFNLNGEFYRKWITAMLGHMDKSMQKLAENGDDPNAKQAAQDFQQNMQAIKKQAEHIDGISESFRMDKQGLVINAEVRHH